MVIGSEPIVVEQAAEFDYAGTQACCVLKEQGYEVIMVNNNHETVSTDYNMAEKLCFGLLTIEDVMHIINIEKPLGVVVEFGGQTAFNLEKGFKK